jgi:steroid 5-alpha reductase family enzyme
MTTWAWMPLFHVFLGMFTLMTLLWIYQLIKQDATIVDVGWSLGMGISASYLAWAIDGNPGRQLLAATLIVLWSLRLGGYLFYTRLIHGHGEDPRYRAMREGMGQHASLSFFAIFQAQTLFVVLFMCPFIAVLVDQEPLWQWHDFVAIGFWLIAVLGESIADNQLHAFKSNPDHRGKTCQMGLWRYSRHPNYFFEWLHWFAYPFIAWGSFYGGWAWIMPAMMLLFLVKFTGIPYSEAQALKHRKDYAEYQKKTSQFFPRPPRSGL